MDVERDRDRQGWVVWQEAGRYPDVIVELLSPSTATVDRTTKKELYERTFRTPDYFIFDPFDSTSLQGWHLEGRQYQPLPLNERGWLWCETLGLWLGTWEGTLQREPANATCAWLRFYDAQGNLVLLPEEAERQRADREQQRADLHDCLQQATHLVDAAQRRRLLSSVVIGGGPSGVELAATIADLVPQWYKSMDGNPQEVSVRLINHGEILKGDVNSHLRETAETALRDRMVPVELLIGASVKAIRPGKVEYTLDQQSQEAEAGTIIWTAGTNTHPLIQSLPISDQHRDKHGRLHVLPTLQLPDFPEVFAAGDCAIDLQPTDQKADGQKAHEYEHPQPQQNQLTSAEQHHPNAKPLPPTAQVAYQQGTAIADNLNALALGYDLKPAQVNLRGTLLKLGLENSVANIFDAIQIQGKAGYLIRQGTYLELLPTPIHNFKATTQWLQEAVFDRYHPNADKSKYPIAESPPVESSSNQA